jgi:alpha-beta hydrolase superfamily lysophospholipase
LKRIACSFALVLAALFVLGCTAPPYAPARSAVLADAPPGVTRGQDRFEGAHRTELVEQWWRPASPRAVLAIVHGLKDHGSRYAELASRLAVDQGVAVYAMDLRGHAHSEGVRVDVLDFDDYLTDLDAFVARVRYHEPGARVFVMGHSMGGAIVTRWLEKRKPDVAGAILSGAALKVDVSGVKLFGNRMIAAVSPDAAVFNLDLDDFSRDPKVVEAGKKDPLVWQDAGTARLARELADAIDDSEHHFGEITAPLLVMHGSADKVTPPEGSRELVARAASKDKTLGIYDGFFHDLLHEPGHERVVVDIEKWIGARIGAGSMTPTGASSR